MPPKFDPNEIKVIKFRVVGGEMGATSSLAPKVGHRQGNWGLEGLEDHRPADRPEQAGHDRSVPLCRGPDHQGPEGAPQGPQEGEDHQHNGNITMEDIYNAARVIRPKSLAQDFSGTVREVLGTAQSVGCTVDGEDPHDLIEQIQAGDFECPDA